MQEETKVEGEEEQRFNDFLAWEKASRDTIDLKKIYVDITGDLNAGVKLSQIVYWHLPDKNGETKLRVKKKGRLCLVKARHEWWDEIRLSPKQSDRTDKILQEKRIIDIEIHRFNNFPTTHIFLNKKVLLDLINNELKTPTKNPFLPKDKKPVIPQRVKTRYSPKGKNVDIPQRSKTLTETTTEITNRDYKDNVSEEIESLLKFFKIPKKDKAIWRAVYKNEKDYLLRQLLYAKEKMKSDVGNPVKWIQAALNKDFASSDKDEIDKREREWQEKKDLENAQAEPISGLTCSFDTDIEENPRERIRLWNQMLMECRGHPEVASKIREMIKGIQSGMGPKQQAEKYHNEIEPLMKDREREPVPA